MAASPGTDLVVLFDLPASREELREAAAGATRRIALIQPRQLASLRALAAGGSVTPFTLSESGRSARAYDARVRAELRAALQGGRFGRELVALEPLLDDFDGIEIAAAALQLLERERAAAQTTVARAPVHDRSHERESPGAMAKLFVSVGARDHVRPGDLVGAIANQGGITSAEVGRIDVRESHSIVEVASQVADTVIERVTGVVIRGRRAVVRRDEPREGREGREGGRGRPEGGRSRDSGDRRPPRDAGRRGRGPGAPRRSEPRGERWDPRAADSRPGNESRSPRVPPPSSTGEDE
jgi:ATP-dependent RNA helicase DeaD